VEVTNTGTRAGTEVVQLYTRQRRSRVKQPLRLRTSRPVWPGGASRCRSSAFSAGARTPPIPGRECRRHRSGRPEPPPRAV
ncbi:hypothetical protein, partial [Micromonospora sp. NPDC003776]